MGRRRETDCGKQVDAACPGSRSVEGQKGGLCPVLEQDWPIMFTIAKVLSELIPRGPTFLTEPPSIFQFTNTSGGQVDCSGQGRPELVISWYFKDGRRLNPIPGIIRIYQNGTLVILPFSENMFRPDVHSATVHCVLSNTVGTIISRDVHIKPVITRPLRLRVENYGNSIGCPSILCCRAVDNPSTGNTTIHVHSWLQQPSLTLFPTQQSESRQHHLPSGHLYISRMELNDRYHQYRCRATLPLSHDIITSEPSTFSVQDKMQFLPPVFVEHSTKVSVHQYDGAILLCLVNSCPEADISWFTIVDGMERPLKEDPRIKKMGSFLSINGAIHSDSGVYRCQASNDRGNISADMKLEVTIPLTVEVRPSELNITQGSPATFHCIVSLQSNYKIYWYKDGKRYPTSSEYQDIIKIHASTKDDKGMYQCVVRTDSGDTASGVGQLLLGDAPPALVYAFIEQTVQPGPSISLKCSANGNPAPTIAWRLDGFEIKYSTRVSIGSYLSDNGDIISHVNYTSTQIEDGGEYSCIATNRAGSVEHSARLNVYGPPTIREFPQVVAVAGGTFVLKCPVSGYPLGRVYWERGSKELPEDLRQKVNEFGVLTIFDVTKGDAGEYTCWAKSKQGEIVAKSTNLQVIAPPKLSPFQTSPITLNVGERASLTCSVAHGDLPLDFHWRKNGKRLTSGDATITQLDNFTSVLTIEYLVPNNTGQYSCFVQNRAMEVKQTRAIEVNVPPIIEPFHFQQGLTAASRTRLLCGVSRADLPLTLSWLKDNRPLTSDIAVVSVVDSYSSLLSFPRLDSSHSGRYTCVAKNSGGNVSYSADLLVRVPPMWDIEPTNVSFLRGSSNIIDCKAFAVPPANITWKIGIGGKSGDFIDIIDRTNLQILPNGSLVLHSSLETVEGFYLCQAQNGVGNGIGKVIYIKINSAPYFVHPPSTVKVKKGDTAHLPCFISGDPPITVRWFTNSNLIVSENNYRININTDLPNNVTKGELTILDTLGQDAGVYICQGTNEFGTGEQGLQLIVQEPPKPPYDVHVTEIDSESVKVDWIFKYIGDMADITKFVVEYKEHEKSEIDPIYEQWQKYSVTTLPLDNYAVIHGLKPATLYVFRVMAASLAGLSTPSEEVMTRTEQINPGGPPTFIYMKAISSSSVHITWKPPREDLRHGDITEYLLYVNQPSKSEFLNYTVATEVDHVGMEYTITGLEKYTKYFIQIQAANRMGYGPSSEPIAVQTMEDVPTASPTGLKCSSITPQSLQLTWIPPLEEERNGRIIGYRVTYEPIVDEELRALTDYQPITLDIEHTNCVINGLHKFTNFSFYVVAYTSVGDGPPSEATTCTTDEDVPEAPYDIKVVPTSSQSLSVLWKPPDQANGIIIRYNLYIRVVKNKVELDHQRLQLLPNITIHEISNLPLLVEHQFWITASTRTGEGKSSKVTSIILTGEVNPNILAFGGELIRPWRGSVILFCPAVGFSKREWKKNRIIIEESANIFITPSGDLTLKFLEPDDSGNFTCEVQNNTSSNSITYYLHVQGLPLPPQPYGRSSTSNSVVIGWTHNLRRGDAPVQEYTLSVMKDQSIIEKTKLSRFATNYEIKNLKCGNDYEVFMTALNAIGESNTSNIVYVKTQGRIPSPPKIEEFIRTNITSATININSWMDNNCPIIDATIFYKKAKDRNWISEYKGLRKLDLQDLSPGTKYTIRAEIGNEAGYSTNEFSFYTLSMNGDPLMKSINDWFEDLLHLEFRAGLVCVVLIGMLIILIVIIFKCISSSNSDDNRANQLDNSLPSDIIGRNISGHNEFISMERLSHINAASSRRFGTVPRNRQDEMHLDDSMLDKIPETSDDISPYATFQLLDNRMPRMIHSQDMSHEDMHHFVPHIEHHIRPIDNPHTVLYHERLAASQRREKQEFHKHPYNRRFDSVDSESEEEDIDSSLADSFQTTMLMKSRRQMDIQSSSPSSDSLTCDKKTFRRKYHVRRPTQSHAETKFICEPPKEVHRPEALRAVPGPSTSQMHTPRFNEPKKKSSKHSDYSIAV